MKTARNILADVIGIALTLNALAIVITGICLVAHCFQADGILSAGIAVVSTVIAYAVNRGVSDILQTVIRPVVAG